MTENKNMNEDPQVEQPSTPKPKSEWTYRGWYQQNKQKLADKRKAKYVTDKAYRRKVLDQNKNYRAKKAKDRPEQDKTRSRVRKPVLMTVVVGGLSQEVVMVHIGAFARSIDRSVPTVHQWERVGVLPRTPFLLRGKVKEERLYTAEMIDVVKKALSTRGPSISASDVAFRSEIIEGWAALGIKVEE